MIRAVTNIPSFCKNIPKKYDFTFQNIPIFIALNSLSFDEKQP